MTSTVESNRLNAGTSFSYTSGTVGAVIGNVWTLASSNAGYTLEAKAHTGQYVVFVSNQNQAKLDNSGSVLTIEEQEGGGYHVTVMDDETKRYLSKNSSSAYFAFYGNTGQNATIYLIPAQVMEQVATPTITGAGNATEIPADGTLSVTLACATPEATIHYTTDGSTPTAQSTVCSASLSLSEACTVKAIAVKNGMITSEVASQEFTKEGGALRATYTVTSKTAVSSSGTIPQGSTATYSQTYSTVNQMTSGNSITLTLNGYAGKTIVGASVSVKSNKSSGTGSLSLVSGSNTIASIANAAFSAATWNGEYSTDYVDKDLSVTETTIAENATIVLTISASANSLFFESLTLLYE